MITSLIDGNQLKPNTLTYRSNTDKGQHNYLDIVKEIRMYNVESAAKVLLLL